MDAKQISLAHRGLEAKTAHFILAMVLSLLFAIVTWRWAALVNPRIWTVWEDSGATVSQPVAFTAHTRRSAGNVAPVKQSGARRKQISKAMLLRMLALGFAGSRAR